MDCKSKRTFVSVAIAVGILFTTAGAFAGAKAAASRSSASARSARAKMRAKAQQRIIVPKRILKRLLSGYRKRIRGNWSNVKRKLKQTWAGIQKRLRKAWSKGLAWLRAKKKKSAKQGGKDRKPPKRKAGTAKPERVHPKPVARAPYQPAPSPEPAQPPAASPAGGVIFPFKDYRQCSGPWEDVILGEGPKSICGAGCALTSMAMLLQFYGLDLTPDALNAKMQASGWFSGNSISHWPGDYVGKSVGDSWEGSRSADADWEANWEKNATKALSLIHDNFAGSSPKPMVAQVDYLDDSDHKGQHFVLIAGVTSEGDPLVSDPGSSEPTMPGALSQMRRHSGMLILRVLWLE